MSWTSPYASLGGLGGRGGRGSTAGARERRRERERGGRRGKRVLVTWGGVVNVNTVPYSKEMTYY